LSIFSFLWVFGWVLVSSGVLWQVVGVLSIGGARGVPLPPLLFGSGDAEELFESRLGFGLVVLEVSGLWAELFAEDSDGLSFAFGFEVELVEVPVLESGVVHFFGPWSGLVSSGSLWQLRASRQFRQISMMIGPI